MTALFEIPDQDNWLRLLHPIAPIKSFAACEFGKNQNNIKLVKPWAQ